MSETENNMASNEETMNNEETQKGGLNILGYAVPRWVLVVVVLVLLWLAYDNGMFDDLLGLKKTVSLAPPSRGAQMQSILPQSNVSGNNQMPQGLRNLFSL